MTTEIRLPAGLRDYLPRSAARRRAIAERLCAEFDAWGYERIITPIFEVAEVLERGLGTGARAAAIRFVEPGSGEVVALRPDITPQVARLAATRLGDVGGPVRLSYEGLVARLAGEGRAPREVLQAGIELIGVGSPEGDAEAISLAAHALAATGIPEVRLDVSHVSVARAALDAAGEPGRRAALERALARKDRAGCARLAAELSPPAAELCAALPTLYGEPAAVLARARALTLPAEAAAALDAIEEVLAMIRDAGAAQELHSSITLDLGEVRGFEYYTGIRFFGYAAGAGDAILRGGRYDELVGRYGRAACATGFAVDVEAVAEAQAACGLGPAGPPAGVLISGGARAEAARIAAALRQAGWRAALDPGPAGEEGELRGYAQRVGFSRVLLLAGEGARIAGGETVDAGAIADAAAGRPAALIAVLQGGVDMPRAEQ